MRPKKTGNDTALALSFFLSSEMRIMQRGSFAREGAKVAIDEAGPFTVTYVTLLSGWAGLWVNMRT